MHSSGPNKAIRAKVAAMAFKRRQGRRIELPEILDQAMAECPSERLPAVCNHARNWALDWDIRKVLLLIAGVIEVGMDGKTRRGMPGYVHPRDTTYPDELEDDIVTRPGCAGTFVSGGPWNGSYTDDPRKLTDAEWADKATVAEQMPERLVELYPELESWLESRAAAYESATRPPPE